VHALGTDGLLIEFTLPAPLGEGELAVALSGHRTYALPVSYAPNPTPSPEAVTLAARVEPGPGRERLHDLLAVVRKSQHITICATMDVEASDRYTGLTDVSLVPMALPNLAWDELDTRASFLGRTFPLPLLITGMTGGLARGAEINLRLARAAAAFGIPMGVGSQRVALENPEHAAIFSVKKAVPELFLIGNIGVTQLSRPDAVDLCRRAVDMIDANALAIHVNVLQEVIQVEGDRDFRGLVDRIGAVAARLDVPVLVKEVGGGIDPRTAAALVKAGVAAIDCGGRGGTSWSFIEGVRAQSPVTRAVADTFRDWGIPTAIATATLRRAHRELDLVATGGIRDGLAVAKAVALGATMVGIGLPLLRAALNSNDEPHQVLETLARGLKTAMLCAGAPRLAVLAGRLHATRPFREALARWTEPAGPWDCPRD